MPTEGNFPYGLFLFTGSGLFYGQAQELVYKYEDSDTLLSELLWDLKPLFYLETGLEFSRSRPLESPGFLGELSLRFGFPAESGAMEDRDWASRTGEDFLTMYSRHAVFSEAMTSADLRLGASIPLFSRLVIKLYLDVSYFYIKWTGQDGYGQYPPLNKIGYDPDDPNGYTNIYPPWDDSLPVTYYSGPIILYTQDWLAVSPGFSAGSSFLGRFSWELGLSLSPFLYGADKDNHLTRKLQFNDFFSKDASGGIYLDCRGDLTFSLNERIGLGLYLGFRYVKGQRGNTYMKATGSIGSDKSGGDFAGAINGAGAGYSLFDMGLSVKVRM